MFEMLSYLPLNHARISLLNQIEKNNLEKVESSTSPARACCTRLCLPSVIVLRLHASASYGQSSNGPAKLAAALMHGPNDRFEHPKAELKDLGSW